MRLISLTITAVLLIAGPAGAQEKLCRGQFAPEPLPSEEINELRSHVRLRASFGFRHDVAYVKDLIRRGQWTTGFLEMPATRAENRYLGRRDRLELGAAARRYLSRHADVDGGVSIEDDWPRNPYLLVRFTRDLDTHLAALKRLVDFPDHLRAKRIRHSLRERTQVEARILADDRTLRRAGFWAIFTTVRVSRIDVDVITRRTDAREYFARRYGPLVRVRVRGTHRTVTECTRAEAYAIASDGLT